MRELFVAVGLMTALVGCASPPPPAVMSDVVGRWVGFVAKDGPRFVLDVSDDGTFVLDDRETKYGSAWTGRIVSQTGEDLFPQAIVLAPKNPGDGKATLVLRDIWKWHGLRRATLHFKDFAYCSRIDVDTEFYKASQLELFTRY